MKKRFSENLLSQVLTAAVFAVLGVLALYVFVRVAEPDERQPRPPYREDYSEEALLAELTGEAFEARLQEIQAAGRADGERGDGRFTGSAGFYRTEQLILDTFRSAGLEIVTQELPVTVPVTELCEIVGEDGKPLEGVTLYPFAPSGPLPTALPPEGISGQLMAAESTELKHLSGVQPEDSIVLTFLDSITEWQPLTAVGVQALIVREDEAAKAIRANPDVSSAGWAKMDSRHAVTFPRFLARGPIEQYAGQRITIRCKVTWQQRIVRNLVGVLRGDTPSEEALIMSSFYDAMSVVPELAPGAEQSLSLAAMLEYVRAMSSYRGQLERDVVFVATAGHAQALSGVCRLLEAIEPVTRARSDYVTFAERKAVEQRALDYTQQAVKALPALEQAALDKALPASWNEQPEAFRKWFDARMKTVAGEIALERKDATLERQLEHERAGSPVFRDGFDALAATDEERQDEANSHPLLVEFLAAKQLENRAANLMSSRLDELVAWDEFTDWNYLPRLREYLDSIAAYHVQQLRELSDLEAVEAVLGRYRRTLTLNLELYSGGHQALSDLVVAAGIRSIGTVVEPQVTELSNLLTEKAPRKDDKAILDVIQWGSKDFEGTTGIPTGFSTTFAELESTAWFACGRMAFSIMDYKYHPKQGLKTFTPEDTLDGTRTDVLKVHLSVVGRALLAMAHGRVPLKAIPSANRVPMYGLHGTVFANAGVSDVVPSHRMRKRTVAEPLQRDQIANYSMFRHRGIDVLPVLSVNPYGEYVRTITFDFPKWGLLAVDAATFDEDGRLTHIKDMSAKSQAIFRNEMYPVQKAEISGRQEPPAINVAVFRCAPVGLYDKSNPTTLRSFKGVEFLSKLGLGLPEQYHNYNGAVTAFLDPVSAFYVAFRDGAPANEEIQTHRAFMLNPDPEKPITENEPELYGRGFLAADTEVLTFPHIDAAASMLRTAEKRLALQHRYNMADEQMLEFHERGQEWLDTARQRRAQHDTEGAVSAAATSLAYAMNNHPVIRSRISHAVIGILWYLGLLVPFVFFCEKLIFGFPDIRKQLLADGAIFLVVFALLRVFHPAFQMVRSSLMILLGFIIFLLTGLVTLMVSGKFKQNIKDLRSKEGHVEGADISRGGVVGTAFMLGLNNMRRRKVRTGLTCVTLILITFVMICFTSVSTDLVNIEYVTGRSAWNGIMIRDLNFLNMEADEINNIQRTYGSRFPVTFHKWLVTELMQAENVRNPAIVLDREFEVGDAKVVKRSQVSSGVTMDWKEPLFSGIDKHLLTNRGWFPRPPSTREEKLEAALAGERQKHYVMLPDTVASELAISVEDVNNGNPTISIRGAEFEVLGIFNSTAMDRALGLDGDPIMPYDLNTVQAMGTSSKAGGRQLVPEDVDRLPAAEVILVNADLTPEPLERTITVSCSILFPKEPYRVTPDAPELKPPDFKGQRRVVLEYLERTGKPAFYATDGVSYYGSRKRAKTVAGLLDLLVPILIAALTVFNTMRGSVYERKDEIYVYNAVGIAPNHVFFMFMAEACVYAVMGAMLGYVLSQATGRLLTALDLTGGMNMDYSSIETIYASLAIMVAVMLSTLIPARSAAKMASPSGIVSWAMPKPDGDEMQFTLPFTFTPHDRLAVISYFCRWLDAHGEGSSGRFYCAPPEAEVRKDGDLVPVVSSTIWLKPYDLGVSQRVEISLPTDEETDEYIATIRLSRLSGNSSAWKRTVKPFLASLRKQFLNWRATTDDERREMFAEAKDILNRGRQDASKA